jgi:RNA polymerase sigma-70 factor (ECF subfamily)
VVYREIWERASAFDHAACSVHGWIGVLARSRAIDRWRRNRQRARIVEALGRSGGDGVDAEPESAHLLDCSRARAALTTLGSDRRRMIELAFFGAMTHSEIANELGTAVGTVKSHIRRGLLQLRKSLGAGDAPD